MSSEDQYEGFTAIKDTSFGLARGASRSESVAAVDSKRMRTTMATRAGMSTASTPGLVRPVTSKQSAGFTSNISTSSGNVGGARVRRPSSFDPMNQGKEKTDEENERVKLGQQEHRVQAVLEESYFHARNGDFKSALEKAKDAIKKERQLSKDRELLITLDAPTPPASLDLTFVTLLNLADQYNNAGLFQESLNTFSALVKSKQFSQSAKLRINMGHIHFTLGQYDQAIKMFRMALDQCSANTNSTLRAKILTDIGVASVKMNMYSDAVESFESVLEVVGEGEVVFRACYNLIVCYFALGDADGMQSAFLRLVALPVPVFDSDDDGNDDVMDSEVKMDDELREFSRERVKAVEGCVFQTARIIAPAIDASFQAGFDWVINTIRQSKMSHVANELDMAKVVDILKSRDSMSAIEAFRTFEKREPKMMAAAATNLTFLFTLGGELEEADRYAQMAIQADHYSAKALVNRGVCLMQRGKLSDARQYFEDAVAVDSLCAEAQFNLGLVMKQTKSYEESLVVFEKLHSLLQADAAVVYHIADIHAQMNNDSVSLEWYNRLLSLVPTDPYVLAEIARLYQNQSNQAQAFHYYSESYRYFPCNLDVLTWLGSYCVEHELYEQAVNYFERAVLIQPRDIKWPLMIASCVKRSGNLPQALQMYKDTHDRFPQNVECLKFLVRLCGDMGLSSDAAVYANKILSIEQADREKSVAIATNGEMESPTAPPSKDGRQDSEQAIKWDDDDLLPEF